MEPSVETAKRTVEEFSGDAVFAIKEKRPTSRYFSESDEEITDKVGEDSLLIVGKPSTEKQRKIKAILAAQRRQKNVNVDESILGQAHSIDSSKWLLRYIFEWDTYVQWDDNTYEDALTQILEHPILIRRFPRCVSKDIAAYILENKTYDEGRNLFEYLENCDDKEMMSLHSDLKDRCLPKVKKLKEEMSAIFGPDYKLSSTVKEEINSLQKSFPKLAQKYVLYNKVGEGTFSSVYIGRLRIKWCDVCSLLHPYRPNNSEKPPLLALKKIYVTSSPQRIFNELDLLFELRGKSNVAPLLDVLRWEDQVVAVLPYYEHTDFRDLYRDIPLSGIRMYMYQLLQALEYIHSKDIIHRDIKPTNFLYNHRTGKGVLVDFGLAERYVKPTSSVCPCMGRDKGFQYHDPFPLFPKNGYLKDDPRPGKRANRAGTRGFRAPEVLFKCNNQTPSIDIWSAGVILLSLLSRRFPFFNSTDDTEALMEITCIFGTETMQKCAHYHNIDIQFSIPPSQQVFAGKGIENLIVETLKIDCQEGDTFAEDSPAWELLACSLGLEKSEFAKDYKYAFKLLEGCIEPKTQSRLTAEEALKEDFFKPPAYDYWQPY